MKELFAISLILTLIACKNNSVNEQPLAKVGKVYLYPSVFLGDDYSATDVEKITEIQIEEWVKNELWYAVAKQTIEDNIEIENKVKNYEQSLYINAYQDKLVQNQLNIIGKEEVVAYYSKHKMDYVLNENQYKIRYIELSSEISNLEDIISSLNEGAQSQFIEDYCLENKNLCLLEATWVNDDKLKEIELPDYIWQTSAKFQRYYKGNDKVCVFRILEKKKEGESIPLELVSEEIATILYFNKSKEILKKQEDQLFKNAQNNQNFEIYK